MAFTNRALIVTVAFAALTMASGCFFLDGQFVMAPDGAVEGRIEAGVLQAMAEQGEGEVQAELDEGLVEDLWTREEPFDRGQWRVTALTGRAAPGQSLFKDDAEPSPEFEMTRRLLSTEYSFVMPLPEGPDAVEEPAEEPAPAAEDVEVQVEGMEGLGEAFGEMMAMMMTSGDSGLRFSVALPGVIVDTNGVLVDPSRAAWTLDIAAEEPPFAAMHARSRLANWATVGRVAAALTELGRWDLVPALIAGVERGVLPDPLTDDAVAAQFNALTYLQALEIMIALDHAAGEQIADRVMIALGLSDDPDPAMVEEIAVRLEGIDLAAEIDGEVTEQLLRRLRGG